MSLWLPLKLWKLHIICLLSFCHSLQIWSIRSLVNLLEDKGWICFSEKQSKRMGRGVSSGGGQSSLNYLFGSGEAPKPVTNNTQPEVTVNSVPPSKPAPPPPQPVDVSKQIAAGINSHSTDGQNTGNFITDRPSTKVHAAPGGGSSLGYLFGGPGDGK
ncbi:hypothetical protein L6164_027015 [Bauhinia variegata]|uniref:Uncharacterized protein n=1 Tax=Bauhinia variegata TaxID=167791 RepID=A0ACB9LTE9_BAUVA|nr:hypothetical protein L6164_027015 [Bauhinia variegata]